MVATRWSFVLALLFTVFKQYLTSLTKVIVNKYVPIPWPIDVPLNIKLNLAQIDWIITAMTYPMGFFVSNGNLWLNHEKI